MRLEIRLVPDINKAKGQEAKSQKAAGRMRDKPTRTRYERSLKFGVDGGGGTPRKKEKGCLLWPEPWLRCLDLFMTDIASCYFPCWMLIVVLAGQARPPTSK